MKVISGFSIEDNSIATLLSSILNLLVIPLAIYLHTTLNAISLPTKSRCNNFHKLPCKASPQPEFRFSSNKNMTYFQAHKQTNEAYETENPLSLQDYSDNALLMHFTHTTHTNMPDVSRISVTSTLKWSKR